MYNTETDKRVEIGFEVVENTSAMLAYWDKDLVCRFANQAHMEWLGIDPDEMINEITLQEMAGAQFEKLLPHIRGVLKGNIQVFEGEFLTPTGRIINSIATYSPHKENGQIAGVYVHVSDITLIKNKIALGETESSHLSEFSFLYGVDKSLRSSLLTGFPGIAALSKQHYISESKLKRAFKDEFGTSIFSYYRSLQMEYADKYISENKSTKKQMAAMLNFINPSNFSACYQKYLKENVAKKLIEKLKKDNHERYKTFVNQSPFAFAMFDRDMRFIETSQKWRQDYNMKDEKFTGRILYEVFPDTEKEWKSVHEQCVGNDTSKTGESFFHKPDGTAVWIKWDMRPWHNDKNEVSGLMIFTDDITNLKNQEDENRKMLEILNKTNEVARIGAWKRNFKTKTGIWSKILKEILEVDEDYEPSIETAIEFYKEGYSRDLIKSSINNAVNNGISFDVEAIMITAKGNEKRERVIGYPDFKNGQCEKLMGIFQEIPNVSWLKKV